ncbi:phospho-N-acetylmuramoyl-pentapeptide-transferase [Treponema sp.]|uniref:phospho-N-acetylmuramoyl-pentapeptide- transferase n=1 Tax=Treponema sp. TaxID=166 RepID=UPI00298EC569|nr:phospho-N-acetylmuramoyl-pentapeptide-transferase [Treponema sp.]MCR5612838.1 phospho-N-acetylmuramoyl-pentapeptide-transferase [Treponema sp.]
MLFYLGSLLQNNFGPARLLQSFTVLIVIALYLGFILSVKLVPKFYDKLPHDRGREFTEHAADAKGKPTGAGIVFITIFVVICVLCIPLSPLQACIIALTWLSMLTGYLDDRSVKSWGEYLKGALDLVICLAASACLYYFLANASADGKVYFWLPFLTKTIEIPVWIYIIVSTIILWTSINTTNCTDGVDGLSSMLILVALITLGCIFYFVLGHKEVSGYLLVPHLATGANWGAISFAMAGVLMGYLWHNAYPSKVMMGDAGSRALGFFLGASVMVSGNPFLIFAISSIILVNGGMGLVKVALLRFFKISIFKDIRFPLHDHMRKKRGWSATQVVIKFLIMQLLFTVALVGLFLKIR